VRRGWTSRTAATRGDFHRSFTAREIHPPVQCLGRRHRKPLRRPPRPSRPVAAPSRPHSVRRRRSCPVRHGDRSWCPGYQLLCRFQYRSIWRQYGDTRTPPRSRRPGFLEAGAIGINIEDGLSGGKRQLVSPEQACSEDQSRAGGCAKIRDSSVHQMREPIRFCLKFGSPDDCLNEAARRAKVYAPPPPRCRRRWNFCTGLTDLALIEKFVQLTPLPVNIMVTQGVSRNRGSRPRRRSAGVTWAVADDGGDACHRTGRRAVAASRKYGTFCNRMPPREVEPPTGRSGRKPRRVMPTCFGTRTGLANSRRLAHLPAWHAAPRPERAMMLRPDAHAPFFMLSGAAPEA